MQLQAWKLIYNLKNKIFEKIIYSTITGYILTVISAIIFFLSFTPAVHGYTAFLSLVPFFYALSKTGSIKKAALTGAIWGISLSILFSIPLYYALVTEYEFSIIFSTLLIFVSVYIPYAIIYGVFGISFIYFFDKKNIWFPFIAASLWILVDYTMNITPFFLPWGYAGYSQTSNIFIQFSDISGIFGVTFIIVLINLLLTGILINKKENLKFSSLIIFFIIISAAIYGNLRIQSINRLIQSPDKNVIKAAVIQGNFSSKEKWDSKNTAAVINTYINMTKQIIGKADIIVWPETVLNSSDTNNLEIISGMSSLLKNNQIFISGATRYDTKKIIYNSIFTADKNGLGYIYDKKILFPFTETSLSGMSSGNFMDSPAVFNTGKTRSIYKNDSGIFGYTICFETIYPEYVRKIKNLGAEVLINVANDSWFGNTYEPYMQLYSTIARAVENRFYVLRASNSGISAIISPSGEVLSSAELNKRDKIVSSIKIMKIPSFYSKAGDWIIVVSLLIIIISLALQLKSKK